MKFHNKLASALSVMLYALFAPGAKAQALPVPGAFIVELDTPDHRVPKADAAKFVAQRRDTLRAAMEQTGVVVRDTFDTLLDGFSIRNADPQTVASLPGVRAVYPVVEMQMQMDRAVERVRAREAWREMGGIDKAGIGARIAIVDSGINRSHPAFADEALPQLPGFPKIRGVGDLAASSRKIVAVRSYGDLVDEPEMTAEDTLGHGSAVAAVAAGVSHRAPLAEIAGVAPKAYLGSYKVFNSRGRTRNDVIVRAMEDAVNDGMDVINLSLGSHPTLRPERDAIVRAAERASELGVIVVTAAGNGGPDAGSLSSLSAGSPLAIAVGGVPNDRTFGASVAVEGFDPIMAIPSDAAAPDGPVEGVLDDVARLDGSGLACAELPEASLTGKIAYVVRGECTFERKMRAVQVAGAVAAVVRTNSSPVGPWTVAGVPLPGLMISSEDGRKIQTKLASGAAVAATLNFRAQPFRVTANSVWESSSRGPSLRQNVKPDLIAVSAAVYTAAQSTNPLGDIYDPSGYRAVSGTSFSAPMVAGAAAALKSHRRGLTLDHYRSLLVNAAAPLTGAGGIPSRVHAAGSGLLNVEAALRSPVAASPTSISFGVAGGVVQVQRPLSISNLAARFDTYTIVAAPIAGPAPVVTPNQMLLLPGLTRGVQVSWTAAGLEPGEYQGFLIVRGTLSDTEIRIPYWYGVTDLKPAGISVVNGNGAASLRAGQRTGFFVRVGDASGSSLMNSEPRVEAVSGDGAVDRVSSADEVFPGYWAVDVHLGPLPAENVFKVSAGGVTKDVTIRGN